MSCGCNHQDFCVSAGATWNPVVRWATDVLKSAPITAITNSAPVQITAAAHGVTDGWPVAVVGVQGMVQINSTRYPPAGRDWRRSTVVDANTIAINSDSSADWSTYLAGGYLVYSTPVDLADVIATLTIWDNPEHQGTPLATLVSGSGGIVIDPTGLTIKPLLQTAGLAWQTGYYTLAATDGDIVTELMDGVITIE